MTQNYNVRLNLQYRGEKTCSLILLILFSYSATATATHLQHLALQWLYHSANNEEDTLKFSHWEIHNNTYFL